MLCLSLILAGKHYTVVVADRDGYWLELRKAPDEAGEESAFTVTGANWVESSVGNTGIGTVLATSEPVVVHGTEHFCHAFHGLTSLGVPITVDGELVGVLGHPLAQFRVSGFAATPDVSLC
jgi:transcriptional regulator of acetoin/glycerol metabolism